MKIVRICMAILATLTFASIAAAQCGPARPKTTAGAGSLEEMIVAQETSIIESVKKGDSDAFKTLVDVNGTVVDSQGIRKIGDVIPELFGPTSSSLSTHSTNRRFEQLIKTRRSFTTRVR